MTFTDGTPGSGFDSLDDMKHLAHRLAWGCQLKLNGVIQPVCATVSGQHGTVTVIAPRRDTR